MQRENAEKNKKTENQRSRKDLLGDQPVHKGTTEPEERRTTINPLNWARCHYSPPCENHQEPGKTWVPGLSRVCIWYFRPTLSAKSHSKTSAFQVTLLLDSHTFQLHGKVHGLCTLHASSRPRGHAQPKVSLSERSPCLRLHRQLIILSGDTQCLCIPAQPAHS